MGFCWRLVDRTILMAFTVGGPVRGEHHLWKHLPIALVVGTHGFQIEGEHTVGYFRNSLVAWAKRIPEIPHGRDRLQS